MIEEAFGYRISQETMRDVLPDYRELDKRLDGYTGTNNRAANNILTDIMDREEKSCLERVFFGKNGWYQKINDEGALRIKLAAMSLGLTNDVFTVDKKTEERMLARIETMSEEEQLLMMRCYIKQKTVTYITMRNYLRNIIKTDKMSILLYRGINTPYQNGKYFHCGMESWTTNINTAYRFAKAEGFVVEKEYPINQIFAGKRSTFKNRAERICRHNGFYVRRENEMIVENFERDFDCRDGKGISFAVDKEIY